MIIKTLTIIAAVITSGVAVTGGVLAIDTSSGNVGIIVESPIPAGSYQLVPVTPSASASPSASPSSTPAGTLCTAQCGPYTDSLVTGTTGDIYVNNDVWSPPSGTWSQSISVTSASQWTVTADFPAGNTSVSSYPDVYQDQDWLTGTESTEPLSYWSSINSSFSTVVPTASGNVGEFAYDLWLNSWGNEVMIQENFTGDSLRPRCSGSQVIATAGFSGSEYNLCEFGSELIWQQQPGKNEASGSISILPMLQWLENASYLPAQSDLTSWSFGAEICSTGGQPSQWTLNSFSFTAIPEA
jgi:hypothetical protein